MKYDDPHLHFSFNLPDDWRLLEHRTPLAFGGLGGMIEFKVGEVEGDLVDKGKRRSGLENHAKKYFGFQNITFLEDLYLGGETNTIVAKDGRPRSSEIFVSAVRDGIQFQIPYTGHRDDQGLSMLLSTFRYGPSNAFIDMKMMPEGGQTEVSRLLKSADEGLGGAMELVCKIGPSAVPELLQSVGRLNNRIRVVLRGNSSSAKIYSYVEKDTYHLAYSRSELGRLLERFAVRIRVLGKIPDEGAFRSILAALVDSATVRWVWPETKVVFQAAMDALVDLGEPSGKALAAAFKKTRHTHEKEIVRDALKSLRDRGVIPRKPRWDLWNP